MRIRTIRTVCVVLIAALVSGTLSGCSRQETVSRDGYYFDTLIRITIYDAPDREAALDEAFELCGHYDSLFNKSLPQSDIGRINSAGTEPVTVSPETIELLELGLYYSELTDGMFDITCGSVTRLWDFTSDTPAVPDSGELEEALTHTGWRQLETDGENSTVRHPEGMSVDVGAIAKGFIADKICGGLRSIGCESAVINLGGNVAALGSKHGKPFRIGVQSPFDPSGFIETLSVTDKSVVTAGSYQRSFTLDGRLYHHILDLGSGMPADTGIASVTIVSESSAQGDALATICFLSGTQASEELIGSLDSECEAYIVKTDGTVAHFNSTRR